MKGFIATVLGIGALVAFLVPHGHPAGSRADPAEPPIAQAHLAAATAPQAYGGEMVLDREGDGHFYATVQIGSRDFRMLVDTGATVVALTGEDARDIGLDWDPNALAPVARGAGGPVMGVPVTIDSVAVGDFEAREVQAVIIPEGLGVSLLGQSFLSHIPKVAIAENKLTLSD